MKQLRILLSSRWDMGIILAALLGLIMAWPFWARPGLPRATDAELHVFRIAELGYSLRSGNLYPRWAPDFYYGHGYPIFNYYAPLTYHLGNWLTLIQPERAVLGAKLLFILSSLLGAVGAYLLGREYGGRSGGLLGCGAFITSPYILLINPHIRGDLPEVFALALVPWAFWFWRNLWDGGGLGSFVGAILSPSVILLSHNLTGLTVMVLLVILSLWHWLVLRHHSRFAWTLLAGLLIVGLITYFWLPFIAERQFIRLNVTGEGHYDFQKHFIALRELLTPVLPLDWGATMPQVPMSMGTHGVILALLGIGYVLYRSIKQAKVEIGEIELLFYLLTAIGCLFLILPASYALWSHVPGLQFYQFPWRFLGPLAALLVPLVAVLGKFRFSEARFYTPTQLVLLGLCLLAGLPGLYPPPWDANFGPVDPKGMIDFELTGRARGTTSTDDFIPTTVDVIPEYQPTLVNSYETGTPDRVNRYTLPDGATVDVLTPTQLPHNAFQIHTPQKFVLRLYLFYFPGWRAYVDGQEVPIEIARPEGFVTLTVPEGQHNVSVKFEDTQPRKLGWGITLISGIILGASCARFTRQHKSTSAPHKQHAEIYYNVDAYIKGATLLICGLMVFIGGVANPAGWFRYTSPPGEAWPAQQKQRANFADYITLLGYDLNQQRLRPGQTLDVTLYWRAQQPLNIPYQSFIHLVSASGIVKAQSDHLNPGDFPTTQWPLDQYIWDRHQLSIPKTLPPGRYTLAVGLYTLNDGQRLSVADATFGARNDHVILKQTITVR